MASRFSIEAIFSAVDKMSAPVNRMEARMMRFARRSERAMRKANQAVDKLGAGLKRVGVAGTAALGGLAVVGREIVKTGAEFEYTLTAAAAKFGGIEKGSAAFASLEAAAKKAGSTTEFSASESAKALDFLAMAGFSAESSITALPTVIDLATASGTDLATASDIASDALGAFAMSSEDAAIQGANLNKISDAMAKTVTSSNTNMELLMETVKGAAPTFTAAGDSLEDFLAMTGTLANAGIKGGDAATVLKNATVLLSAPVGKAAAALKKMGISVKDQDGNFRGVIPLLKELGHEMDGLGSADRASRLRAIFGKIPISGMNVLLDAGADKLANYSDEIEKAAGKSGEMAAMMRDTLKGSIDGAMSAFEGLQLSVFNLKNDAFRGLIDTMTEYLRAAGDILEENGVLADDITENLGGAVSGFAETLWDLAKLWFTLKIVMLGWAAAIKIYVVATKGAALAQKAFNIMMFLFPGTWIVAAIVAVIAAVVLLIVYWDEVVAFLGETWETIKDLFLDGVKWILDKLGNVFPGLQKLINGVTGLLGLGGDIEARVNMNRGDVSDLDAEIAAGENANTSQWGPVSPSAQQGNTVEKITERNEGRSELIVRDETGRASFDDPKAALRQGLKLVQSGGF